MRYAAMMLGLAAFGAATPATAQQTNQYRIAANSTRSINLNVCSNEVRIVANGDDDTDLDFWIYDAGGRLVHSDLDSTDATFVTLHPPVAGGCVDYALRVKNLGAVFNTLSVSIQDLGASATTGSDGKNRRVAVHNHTAEAFTSVRFSNTADTTFGPDRLGASEVQRARTNRTFTIDDGTGACHFDIQVETASGRKYTKSNINVCAVSSVEFGTEISH